MPIAAAPLDVSIDSVIEPLPTKKPHTGISIQDFTADLLKYEGIQVNLYLGRGMNAKHAIKSLYTDTFHTRLKDSSLTRQLMARLAECLNLDMLTFTVLTAAGGRTRSTDTVAALRRRV